METLWCIVQSQFTDSQIDNKTEVKLSLEGQTRPLKRATPSQPDCSRSLARGRGMGTVSAGRWRGKKETQRAIDGETHKQRRALGRQGAVDRKRHTQAEEGLRTAAEAELS